MSFIEERMGPRWSETEIHLFFEGLKKYGKNWSHISASFTQNLNSSIHPRTDSQIEAVYLKNKTYLSIPSANPNDFSAIMADHYDSCESAIIPANDECKSPNFLESFTLPKKRSEKPSDLKTQKKPNQKKFEIFDQVSKPAEPVIFGSSKFQDLVSAKVFPDFSYNPLLFLVDYSSGKLEDLAISPKFLQWCKAEWFYSYIDRGFFSYNEFEECLKSLKLSEAGELTKSEFQVIKAGLGRPRRFSPSFIAQERKKLLKYREAVKVLQQGKVLPSCYHDLVAYFKQNPIGSAARLMVGQKVIAIHPLTKEVRSGSILTLDSSNYHIQFDRQELGVFLVPDHHISLYFTDLVKPEPEESSPFIYKPVQEREVISPNFVIEGFKAGVNIYAMAFLLKLLERKEALIELLKQMNFAFAQNFAENKYWRPDHDSQQQYAWICVSVQAINTSISKVLEIFRLRNRPPPQPAKRADSKIDNIKEAASLYISEELDQRAAQFSDSEFVRIQESLKNGVVLLGMVELIIKENDLSLLKQIDENLGLLSPACESNKSKFEEVCKCIEQLKSRLTNR